ncbi:outer membrane protein transport protein, partial [Pseudomonas aeruginosa]
MLLNVRGGNSVPFQTLGNIDLDMQQLLSPSFNLGVVWEPNDWFAWGGTYQSESWMKVKGKYRGEYGQGWQGFWTGGHKSIGGAMLGQRLPDGIVDEEHGKDCVVYTCDAADDT